MPPPPSSPIEIFFEPWSLGDAVIAAWAAEQRRLLQSETLPVLACNPKHLPLIQALFPNLATEPIDLAYTGRNRRSFADGLDTISPSNSAPKRIYGIRGDFRDWLAAHRRYPGTPTEMSGWGAFAIRRLPGFDLPFRTNWLPTVNRYARWAKLIKLEPPATLPKPPRTPAQKIGIHVGAQWGARKYPYFEELVVALESRGTICKRVGGPGDQTPKILADLALVDFMREEIELLICNESSPMHVAFALNVPTIAIFANTGISEWLPPAALAISHVRAGGYAPRFPYQSDDPHSGNRPWPTPEEILSRMVNEGWVT